jgi:adenylylsulfate kinase
MRNVKAKVLWFTGLSGSGKTTIAEYLRDKLEYNGTKVLILDGDNVRSTISKKLSYSEKDIKTNNLTVANLVVQNQNDFDIIIIPIISPYRKHRKLVRGIIKENYCEVYINCTLEECINRDTKGLYKKAISGQIKDMIGLAESNPYEPPLNAELVIDTNNLVLEESVALILDYLK